jgi:hypothetical protein
MLDRLFRKNKTPPPVGAGALGDDGCFRSTLWFDQPDAHSTIERWQRAGEIDDDLALELRRFVDDGYLTLDLGLDDDLFAEIDATVDRLWRDKPQDVAFAYNSRLTPFCYADEAVHRRPGCRIADLHSYSAAARSLYLHPRIFEVIHRLFGQPAIATQSLYFQYGSFQALHRDPVHVPATPPWHLLAAWVALEDIDPRSGVLAYVPGSHRLPYYRFANGDYRHDASHHSEADDRAMADFDQAQCDAAGLALERFVPKRGSALIWHHSLLHGGPRAEDPDLTRKSFVVHFTTRGENPRRHGEFIEYVPGPDGAPVARLRMVESEALVEAGDAAGFDNPLKRYRVRPPS